MIGRNSEQQLAELYIKERNSHIMMYIQTFLQIVEVLDKMDKQALEQSLPKITRQLFIDINSIHGLKKITHIQLWPDFFIDKHGNKVEANELLLNSDTSLTLDNIKVIEDNQLI